MPAPNHAEKHHRLLRFGHGRRGENRHRWRWRTLGGSDRITFNQIKAQLGDLMYKVSTQKFQDPADGEETLRKYFSDLNEEITEAFAQLTE